MKRAFLQLHIAIILAGFTGILGKLIQLNEGWLTWYRMGMSGLIILAILLYNKKFILPDTRTLLQFFGIGTIISLHWVTFYGSVKYSNVSVAVTCFSAVGFFTSFLEPLIKKRKMDWTEVALGMLVILGIYLIFNFYPEYKMGIIFGMISALFASVFPIFNKTLLMHHAPMTLNFYEMTGGWLALCILLPVYLHFFPAAYFVPTGEDWLWLILLAALCTVWAFDLGLKALQKISAFTVNLSFIMEPVYSIILAFIIFKENQFLGPRFYAGFILILVAVVLQMIRVTRQHKRSRVRLYR